MNRKYYGISVTLPALNEAQNIETLSKEIMHYLEKNNIPYEIIIVNDGSSDNTGIIADELASHYNTVFSIHHKHNKGYGSSLKTGFEASKYDYLFFTDADRQFRIESLDAFLPLMQEGTADMIIGYRIDRQDTFQRKFFSGCFNRMIRVLFSIDYKDIDCAFKLFKKEVFKSLEVTSNDFLFNTELLAKARITQCHIVQLGVPHYPRTHGKSTITYRHILRTFKRFFSLYREIHHFKKRRLPQP